ncbi:unnamed protein product [Microthlaspi erraticum]|uniref:MADS-box domain-containing protein n=1 Tax=Microthlaspi erraticum TaxID=1685480 RepID=A0A6D2LMG1_9BRAS|nr:unnamed protein product [Microthlaspi erraticum]
MGRKMVKMTRITNEKTRLTTYKKRKACLLKKANEFSTLCGVDTCLIVYGPSRTGNEEVAEPELWPKDESKAREIIKKYIDTKSSSCMKKYNIQDCLEKNNTKVEEKVKYCPWDKKLDKCSFNELCEAYVTVGNKIQEAASRNQKLPENNSWSSEQLGLCGFNQQCMEQHQLFPMSTTMEQTGFNFFPFLNQMTSNTGEGCSSFSNVTADPEPEMAQAMYYGTCMDGRYVPMVQGTGYEPMQWSLGNGMFNNGTPFADYTLRFGEVTDLSRLSLEDSGKTPM